MLLSWAHIWHMIHTSTIMMNKATVMRSVTPTVMPIINPRDKGAGTANNASKIK